MSIQHVARTGKTYYLHTRSTKTGKASYHFSTTQEGDLAPSIPEGYEIYENINAQVFLRRKTPQLIGMEELALVEQALQAHAEKWRYKVEIKKNTLVIYESCQDIERLDSRLGSWMAPWMNAGKAKEWLVRTAHYQAVMRFILEDQEKRLFSAERWCFRGSVDGWMNIMSEPSAKLPALVKKFIKHLGQESFYELY